MGIVVHFNNMNKLFSQACNDNLISRQIQSIYAILSGDVLAPNRGEIHPVTWLKCNFSWISSINSYIKNDILYFTGKMDCDHVEVSYHNDYAITIKTFYPDGTYDTEYISRTCGYSDQQRPYGEIEFDIYESIIKKFNPLYGIHVENYDNISHIVSGRYSTIDISSYVDKISHLRTATLKEYLAK